jgi:hypothetical protein
MMSSRPHNFNTVAISAPQYSVMKQLSSNTHDNSFVSRLQKRADANFRGKYRYEEAYMVESETEDVDLRGLPMEKKRSYIQENEMAMHARCGLGDDGRLRGSLRRW